MNRTLYRRISSLFVIAVFALSSIPAAAGAHYDVGFQHKLGHKKHSHSSRFHLSEFSDYDSLATKHKHTGSRVPIIGNADGPCGYLAEHAGHIHAVENGCHKQQGKSFINAEEQIYFAFVKLSVINPAVKVYTSLTHSTLSIRGPPTSLI